MLHEISRRYDILMRCNTVPWIFDIHDILRHCDIESLEICLLKISSNLT